MTPRRRRRPRPRQLTPMELEIMGVLWSAGPSTVQAVQMRLPPPRRAYNTVQTVLNILCRKKHVTRRLEGRAFVYEPAVTRQRTALTAVRQLIATMFEGSAGALMMAILGHEPLTRDEIRRIRRMLRQHGDDSG
jgi:BlaI family transcriptional regulator, penicillinase repressor